jgi:uncharacterized protein with WD repeat
MKTYLIVFLYDQDDSAARNVRDRIRTYANKLQGTEWPSENVCMSPEERFSALIHRIAVIVHEEETRAGEINFAYKYLTFSEPSQNLLNGFTHATSHNRRGAIFK